MQSTWYTWYTLAQQLHRSFISHSNNLKTLEALQHQGNPCGCMPCGGAGCLPCGQAPGCAAGCNAGCNAGCGAGGCMPCNCGAAAGCDGGTPCNNMDSTNYRGSGCGGCCQAAMCGGTPCGCSDLKASEALPVLAMGGYTWRWDPHKVLIFFETGSLYGCTEGSTGLPELEIDQSQAFTWAAVKGNSGRNVCRLWVTWHCSALPVASKPHVRPHQNIIQTISYACHQRMNENTGYMHVQGYAGSDACKRGVWCFSTTTRVNIADIAILSVNLYENQRYIYIYMYVHIYVCTYICMYIHIYIYVYVCIYIYMYVHISISIPTSYYFFNVPSDSGVSREAFWMILGNLPSGGCCSPAGSGQAAPSGDSSGALDATAWLYSAGLIAQGTPSHAENTLEIYEYTHTYIYIFIYTLLYIYIYSYVYIYIFMCIYIYIHIYIYIYIIKLSSRKHFSNLACCKLSAINLPWLIFCHPVMVEFFGEHYPGCLTIGSPYRILRNHIPLVDPVY